MWILSRCGNGNDEHGFTLFFVPMLLVIMATAGPHAIAQFDFEAEESDELQFFKDDVIVLLEKSV